MMDFLTGKIKLMRRNIFTFRQCLEEILTTFTD